MYNIHGEIRYRYYYAIYFYFTDRNAELRLLSLSNSRKLIFNVSIGFVYEIHVFNAGKNWAIYSRIFAGQGI